MLGILIFPIKEYTDLHFLLYAFIGLIFWLVLVYLFSMLFPAERKNLAGLTYKTIEQPQEID